MRIVAMLTILACPSMASIIGQQRAIMGGDEGFLIPVAVSSVVIDAMPYTRTVSCGSYTLTGDYVGAVPTWSASPSGASGSCSDAGGGNFSCVVDVDPDATGEGVETITVSAGSVSDTETIGFYVDGEHSCFLAQNVNGSYNSGLSNLDAVTTWENLGSSALDVTQGTGAAQPTFRTSIVGGQPTVRYDGGDSLSGAAAADWVFLHNGTDSTVESVFLRSSTNTLAVWSNKATATDAAIGSKMLFQSTLTARANMGNGASTIFNLQSGANSVTNNTVNLTTYTVDDDGGAGNDGFLYTNGSAAVASTAGAAYSGSNAGPLLLGADGGPSIRLIGDLFRVLIYQSALTSTQRGINKAVDEWALGGSLPVTP